MKRKDKLLSLREAARCLGKTYGAVRVLIHRHGLETVAANDPRMDRRRRYISRAQLDRLWKSGVIESSADSGQARREEAVLTCGILIN